VTSQVIAVLDVAVCKWAVAGTLLRFAKEPWQKTAIFVLAGTVTITHGLWALLMLKDFYPLSKAWMDGGVGDGCVPSEVEVWGALVVSGLSRCFL